MVRRVHHERRSVNVFNTKTVCPEPFDLAQDRLVEGFMPFGYEEAVFQRLCWLAVSHEDQKKIE